MKKNILIGVCGGIASYKAADLVSKLVQLNYNVEVCMTKTATNFITPMTFSALTGQRTILSDSKNFNSKEELYNHLYPSTTIDNFIIIPATANIIAKIAYGFADDIVSASAISLKKECRRFFCPAMNTQMWDQSIVQENCKKLINNGWKIINPQSGTLACGEQGFGKLADTNKILDTIIT